MDRAWSSGDRDGSSNLPGGTKLGIKWGKEYLDNKPKIIKLLN